MMKKTLLYIQTLLLLSFTCSCEDQQDWAEYSEDYQAGKLGVEVSTTQLNFDDSQQSLSFNITSQCYWNVVTSENWIKTSKDYGNNNSSITVSVQENPSTTTSRDASITVGDGINRCTIRVIQAATKEWIRLDRSSLTFSYEGGTEYVEVSSNVKYHSEATPDWCKVSTSNDGTKMIVRVSGNNTFEKRSCVIRVTGNTAEAQVPVSQEAAPQPTVGISSIDNITKTSARCNVEFKSSFFSASEYGVCYSSNVPTPTTTNMRVYNKVSYKNDAGSFSLTGLQQNTTYYVRPYVITAAGTTYGSVKTFTTQKINSPEEDDNTTPVY